MTREPRLRYAIDDDLTPAQVVARLRDASTAAGKAHRALTRPEHPDDRENLAILLDDFMMLMADASGRCGPCMSSWPTPRPTASPLASRGRTLTAVLDTLPAAVADVLARGEQALAMQDQIRRVGGCEHPIRLTGRADLVDVATGQIRTSWNSENLPDGTVLVACGNRRASRCAPCSRLYQGDAFQLVVAGLRGGKGVPDTVTQHPAVFVTLTAPSFGARPHHPHRPRREACRLPAAQRVV